MENLKIHILPEYRDPNSYLIIEFIRDELFCYFKCINKEKMSKGIVEYENFLGMLHAKNLLAIKHNRYTKSHLYPSEKHKFTSYFYEIKRSIWLKKIIDYKDENDPGWKKYDYKKYKHFVLENYEYWVEVIATDISFNKIKRSKRLLKLWNTI